LLFFWPAQRLHNKWGLVVNVISLLHLSLLFYWVCRRLRTYPSTSPKKSFFQSEIDLKAFISAIQGSYNVPKQRSMLSVLIKNHYYFFSA
jgi:hypothetical protein